MADDNVENFSSFIDQEALNELKSIMEDDFADVLQIFLEESVGLMSEIHDAFAENSDNLVRAVHTLKSCSRNVGAMALGGVAELMEESLLNKDVDTAKSKLEELQDVFAKSHAEINQCMQENMNKVA